MAVTQINLTGPRFTNSVLNIYSNLYPDIVETTTPSYTEGTNCLNISGSGEQVIFNNGIFKITGENNQNEFFTKFYYNNVEFTNLSTGIDPGSFGAQFLGYSFLIDTGIEEANIVRNIQYDSYGTTKYLSSRLFGSNSSFKSLRNTAYLAITKSISTWEQVFFPEEVFTFNDNNYQGVIVNFDCCSNNYFSRQGDSAEIELINQYMTGDLFYTDDIPTDETEIYRRGTHSITIIRSGNGTGYGWILKFKNNDTDVLTYSEGGNGSYKSKEKYVIAINNDLQIAAFVAARLSEGNYYGGVGVYHTSVGPETTGSRLYTWLTGGGAPANAVIANGGGASHVSKVTGQLNSLSSHLSDILLVAGGGGGGMVYDGTAFKGMDAGGIAGNGTNSGNQSQGYGFGLGESSSYASGGGGGLYGGYKGER